jgi:hypothetical protein
MQSMNVLCRAAGRRQAPDETAYVHATGGIVIGPPPADTAEDLYRAPASRAVRRGCTAGAADCPASVAPVAFGSATSCFT